MKVAVACEAGGEVSAHLGRVSQFQVFDIEGGKVKSREVRINQSEGRDAGESGEHAHAGGHHGAVVDVLQGVNTLVCGGLGHRIAMALNDGGIAVLGAPAGMPVDEAVAAFIANKLAEAPTHRCCHER